MFIATQYEGKLVQLLQFEARGYRLRLGGHRQGTAPCFQG